MLFPNDRLSPSPPPPPVCLCAQRVSFVLLAEPPPILLFLLGWVRTTTTHKVMFEDSFKNLVTAKSLGMSTVFVQSDTAREEGVSEAQLETVDAVVRDVRFFFLAPPKSRSACPALFLSFFFRRRATSECMY